MDTTLFIAFWSVSFLFVITPGVDWAYTISAGIQGKVVIPAILGLLIGHFIATIIVALGIGSLIANQPILMTLLTLLGASYLFWIGINLLKSPSQPSTVQSQKSQNKKIWLIKGICVSGLNPKVFLLFLALLPQFTDPNSLWPIYKQMILLGLIHIFSCAVIYCIVGYCAQSILQTRPAVAMIVSRISGLLMIVIGVTLFIEQIVSLN